MSDNATDLFLHLTPEKVLDAVEAAGLRCNPLCYPLNSFENRVYEVELEDKSRIVSKFYRPGRWTEAQILEEHQFMQDLAEAEIPVCPIRPFPDGRTLARQDDIWYCLAERRGGRAPDELSDALSERLGMLVGRIHVVARQRTAHHRIRLNTQNYIRDDLEFLLSHEVLPERVRGRFVAAAREIADIADRLLDGVETHRLHGDLHLGNLLLRGDAFNILDFDDMVVGPPVQDLWLALPGRDAWTLRQREAFLDGYTRFLDFDRSTLRLIEPLRGMRMIHYVAWLARRWHDPVFPATWTHFGTEQYWADETDDLERQLEAVRQAVDPVSYTPPVSEETLTNADLFWDWDKS